jgi:hypothetical protein
MSVLTAGAPPLTTLRYRLDTSLACATPAERAERGKAARAAVPRAAVPRESHEVFDPEILHAHREHGAAWHADIR